MKRIGSALYFILILTLAGCLPDEGSNSLEGAWTCSETSQIFSSPVKGTSIYPVFIAQDLLDNNTYYIDNFYQLGEGIEIKLRLTGNELILERQTVDGILFEGQGTVNVNFDLIKLNYTADDGGGQVDHVNAEYSR